jgi:methyltransferase (TIGR00027 family)
LRIFEVDRPGVQAWKQRRLKEIGFGSPEWLKFVPVDFEAGMSWWKQLAAAGFDQNKPAVIVSTGVSLYLTKEANAETLRQIAVLAPGSTLAMSYILPIELAAPEERPGREMAEKGARASGTPFISFFSPEEIIALALECGFKNAKHVSAADLEKRYFSGRTDGLRPTGSEELLIAAT